MRERQVNSTAHPILFLMVLSSDHITGATGLSPSVTISKDGAAFAAPAGAVSEVGNGWYALAGNATDRNTLGSFVVHASAATADPTDVQYTITAYDPFDQVRLGLTAFPNVAQGSAGALLTAGTGTAQLNVNGGVGDANQAQYLGVACPASLVAGGGVAVVDAAYSRGVSVSLAAAVPVNIVQVNGYTVTGTGRPGHEWGPA